MVAHQVENTCQNSHKPRGDCILILGEEQVLANGSKPDQLPRQDGNPAPAPCPRIHRCTPVNHCAYLNFSASVLLFFRRGNHSLLSPLLSSRFIQRTIRLVDLYRRQSRSNEIWNYINEQCQGPMGCPVWDASTENRSNPGLQAQISSCCVNDMSRSAH